MQKTEVAIRQGATTIYEAAFSYKGVLVRVDILNRKNVKTPWEIIEVKASTEVEKTHYEDLAVQWWVLKNSGCPVTSTRLMHINNECRFPDLKKLFTVEDVTEEVVEYQKGLTERINQLRKALDLTTIPKVDIGPQCNDPHDCPFKDHCWEEKKIPEISVFNVPGLLWKDLEFL